MGLFSSSKDPTCSSCGRKLEAGPMVGSRKLYMGVLCSSCGKVECSACKGNPNNAPCRWCKGEVKPAYDTYLKS